MHCPHWAITAARQRRPDLAGAPIVIHARAGARDLVYDASEQARAEGVIVGMRRREAEARCPAAVLLAADPAGEARAFEPVARSLEAVTARVELAEPGRLVFPTRGPARYFGGDTKLAEAVRATVRAVLAPGRDTGAHPGADGAHPGADVAEVRVGIADGRFTALLACGDDTIVAPGGARAFLAPLSVTALGDPALADLLERLGLTTLGAFAGLPAAAVLERFGPDGARRHAWACGLDGGAARLTVPPPDLTASMELEPPATRVDTAAFAAKTLADRLVAELVGQGLACTRVIVEAETEHGETLTRPWRHEEGFTPGPLAERVRWQLDGWLAANTVVVDEGDVRAQQDVDAFAGSGLDSTTGALTRLTLIPDEVIAVPARQLGFFGGDAAAAARADRALSRVQGLLGYECVGTFVEQGGRTPAERARFVPWGEPREPVRPRRVGGEITPWPGAIPPPAPARVFPDRGVAAELLDGTGALVRVTGRGEARADPARLRCPTLALDGAVRAWAGPWPCDVRWWDARDRCRGARWQVVVAGPAGDVACLVLVAGSRASVEALYD